MELDRIGAVTRRIAQRILTIGENRLVLLSVEIQEERERLLHALLLAIGAAVFGLLAGGTLTALVVVGLWSYSPLLVLATLTCIHGGAAAWLARVLLRQLREGHAFSASLEQLRKDRLWLDEVLA